MGLARLVLVLALMSEHVGVSAVAATITVCWDGSGQYATIQAGIDAASNGDEVVVCPGLYMGAGNRDLDFGGKAITVRSDDPDNPTIVSTTIIDCEQAGRAFYFHSQETSASVVAGFTIKNGYANSGGAILCFNLSHPTIENCTIQDCEAGNCGGGLYFFDTCDPTVRNCVIRGNVAGVYGGGISWENYCNPTISDCIVVGNSAGMSGGGISGIGEGYGDTSIRNCTVSGNAAHGGIWDGGGGIHIHNCKLVITNCIVVGNTSTGCGGGFKLQHSRETNTIANCLIAGNSADKRGGGFFCFYDFIPMLPCGPIIANSTIRKNVAGERGGALYGLNGPDPIFVNCVLWNDQAPLGPEISVHNTSTTVTISNSNVDGGQALIHVEGGASVSWGSGNKNALPLFLDGPSGTWSDDGVYSPSTHQVVFTDTTADWQDDEFVGKFINPKNGQPLHFPIVGNTATTITIWADRATINNGSSQVLANASYQIIDHRLGAYSPCIDAGDNSSVPTGIVTDLDGHLRFIDDPDVFPDTGQGTPPIVDMGAYEYIPVLPADFDRDGDVDGTDLIHFTACASGPAVTQAAPLCMNADMDGDGDVDVSDFGLFQRCYSGENNVGDPSCAD